MGAARFAGHLEQRHRDAPAAAGGVQGQAFLTNEEAAAFAARAAQREADGESRPTAQQTAGQRTGYATSVWFETTHSLSDNRTSLLVDQEDGRLPPLTPEGQKIAQQQAEGAKLRPADDPEDRGAYERCISRGLPGVMMPGFYNHNYQIIQTKDYVVISVEMIYDARIVLSTARQSDPASTSGWETRAAISKGIRSWSKPPGSAASTSAMLGCSEQASADA